MPDDSVIDVAIDPAADDIVIDGDDVGVTRGLEGIAQEARARFSLWRNEWFLDPTEGLPIVERVIQAGTPVSELAVLFRRVLNYIPGIDNVRYCRVSLGSAPRTLEVVWAAQTASGLLESAAFGPFVVPL